MQREKREMKAPAHVIHGNISLFPFFLFFTSRYYYNAGAAFYIPFHTVMSSSSSFSIRPTQRREMAAAVRLNFPFMFSSLLFSSLCTAAAAFISPHVSPFFFLV